MFSQQIQQQRFGGIFINEQFCHDYFVSTRWPRKMSCPRCNSDQIYQFLDRKSFKCASCLQRFSVKTGTIFEDSKLPLVKWFSAVWLVTNGSSAITSTALAKHIQVTQKTAWLMLRRLRDASTTKSFNAPLKIEQKANHEEFS